MPGSARDKQNPEAWFYLGGAYAARVQFRVLRHESLSAARDGKRIKEALDEALRLEPGLDDGQFGLGLDEVYPTSHRPPAKMLRFLLLLPGGDFLARVDRWDAAGTRARRAARR